MMRNFLQYLTVIFNNREEHMELLSWAISRLSPFEMQIY